MVTVVVARLVEWGKSGDGGSGGGGLMKLSW